MATGGWTPGPGRRRCCRLTAESARWSRVELETLPLFLRVTALRFWLSRLYDKTFPLNGELTRIKSPDEYRRQLVLRSDAGGDLQAQLVQHASG